MYLVAIVFEQQRVRNRQVAHKLVLFNNLREVSHGNVAPSDLRQQGLEDLALLFLVVVELSSIGQRYLVQILFVCDQEVVTLEHGYPGLYR